MTMLTSSRHCFFDSYLKTRKEFTDNSGFTRLHLGHELKLACNSNHAQPGLSKTVMKNVST